MFVQNNIDLGTPPLHRTSSTASLRRAWPRMGKLSIRSLGLAEFWFWFWFWSWLWLCPLALTSDVSANAPPCR